MEQKEADDLLVEAAIKRHPVMFQRALEAGADVRKAGPTALFRAVENCQIEMVQALVNRGVKPDVALMFCAAGWYAGSSEWEKIFDLLLAVGVTENGLEGAFLVACSKGKTPLVSRLRTH